MRDEERNAIRDAQRNGEGAEDRPRLGVTPVTRLELRRIMKPINQCVHEACLREERRLVSELKQRALMMLIEGKKVSGVQRWADGLRIEIHGGARNARAA